MRCTAFNVLKTVFGISFHAVSLFRGVGLMICGGCCADVVSGCIEGGKGAGVELTGRGRVNIEDCRSHQTCLLRLVVFVRRYLTVSQHQRQPGQRRFCRGSLVGTCSFGVSHGARRWVMTKRVQLAMARVVCDDNGDYGVLASDADTQVIAECGLWCVIYAVCGVLYGVWCVILSVVRVVRCVVCGVSCWSNSSFLSR